MHSSETLSTIHKSFSLNLIAALHVLSTMNSTVSIYFSFVLVLVLSDACPIDDPLLVDPTTLDIDLSPLIKINDGSKQGGAVTIGLASLTTNATFNFLTMTLSFNLTLKHAILLGRNHNASGIINAGPFLPEILPSGSFTATGNSIGSVSNFVFAGKVVFLLNLMLPNLIIRTLEVDTLSFSHFKMNLGNVIIDGVPMNWQVWNKNFKANWERNWATNKLELLNYIRISVNPKLYKFTLKDLIDFINRPC